MSTPKRTWSDEQISAFLDGELNTADTEALAREVESDPAMAARVERLGAATTMFVAAAAEIDAHPMSAGAKAVLAAPPTAQVLQFRPKNIGAFIMQHRAIAASLICAFAVWGAVSTQKQDSMFEPGSDGVIVASSPLYKALEMGKSSDVVQVAAGVSVTPKLTFAADDGGYCRQFDVSSSAATTSAIACRKDGKWRTQVAVFGRAGAGDYQSASGEKSPMLEAFIDKHIAGAPLDADAEGKAIAAGWTSRN